MARPLWQPTDGQWWMIAIVALFVVCAWPPGDDRSLAAKLVNWAVDPTGALPILPDQLALGQGDDPDAVSARDLQVQQYDALYLKGGWTRRRLELKVARDPFNPATERQLLVGLAVVTALLAWRLGALRNG
jgi:hypothetical protein